MAEESRLSAEARDLLASEIMATLASQTLLQVAERIEKAMVEAPYWREQEVCRYALKLIDEALRRHDEITLGVVIRRS